MRQILAVLSLCAIFCGGSQAETLIGCRKTKIHIACGEGQAITVKSADFSKSFSQCSSDSTDTQAPCSNDVTETVAGLCDDLQTCRFRAKTGILGKGDCGSRSTEVDLEVTYKCETKVTSPPGYTVYGDFGQDCPGEDISSHHVTKQECANICDGNPDCVGFVYSTNPSAAAPCWPKLKLCFIPSALADTAVYKKNKPAPPLADDNAFGYETLSSSGHDCYGKDISHHHVSLQECADICEDTANCVGFVYSTNQVASAPCWPKNELCHIPVPMALTGVFKKLPVEERVPRKFLMLGEYGHDCPGSDLTHYGVSLEECSKKCLEDHRCTGFTYSTDPSVIDLCWPKYRLCVDPVDRINTAIFILEKVPTLPSNDLPNYTTLDDAGDCDGQDIGGFDLSFDECAVRCDELDNCVGFVYSTNGQIVHPCWPKHALCDKPTPLAFTGTFKKNI